MKNLAESFWVARESSQNSLLTVLWLPESIMVVSISDVETAPAFAEEVCGCAAPPARKSVLGSRSCMLGFEILADLGSGALGQVKLAFDAESDAPVAIKLIDRVNAGENQLAQAECEAAALSALRGAPYVVQLRSVEPRAVMEVRISLGICAQRVDLV